MEKKLDHYYSENPIGELKLNKFIAQLRGHKFEFQSGSGVFSIEKIDRGSWLLIEKSTIQDGWDILDLGCGYGPVGIAIAKSFPKTNVILTDINKRAVMLAEKNITLNKIINAVAVQGNLFDGIKHSYPNKLFDTILLNPPHNAGKDICIEMIKLSKDFLKTDGTLQIVARHNKGGKDLSRYMQEFFGNVVDIAKSSGYRIYVSKKKECL